MPPEEETSKEPDHKQLSNLSLSNSIDKKAKNTTPPDLKPDTNFINKENISKNTESASYDEKNMEKDAYHEKEMLPEKKKSFILHLLLKLLKIAVLNHSVMMDLTCFQVSKI